jgi:hypothetical protein
MVEKDLDIGDGQFEAVNGSVRHTKNFPAFFCTKAFSRFFLLLRAEKAIIQLILVYIFFCIRS